LTGDWLKIPGRIVDLLGASRRPVVVSANVASTRKLTLHCVRDKRASKRVRQLLLRGRVVDPYTLEESDEYAVLVDTGASVTSFPEEARRQIEQRGRAKKAAPQRGPAMQFRNADNTWATRGASRLHPTYLVDFIFRECHSDDALGALCRKHPVSATTARTTEYTRGPAPLACLESWRHDPSLWNMKPIHPESSLARQEKQVDQEQPRYIILGMDFMHRWRLICDGPARQYTLELV